MAEEENKEESTFSAENMPKSKEDWNSLRESDPSLWGELSQQNVDKLFRENKELQEKTKGLEAQKNNLTVELESYQRQQQPAVPEERAYIPVDEQKPYSTDNLPPDKKAWDDFMIDDPVEATRLLNYQQNAVTQDKTRFNEAQAASRRTVQGEHPDMYLTELDESGQPRKDDKGNVVLKRDENPQSPTYGEPIFNPQSEKGKLWLQIYNENQSIADSAHAPELLMAAMERRLRVKGERMVDEANQEREQKVEDGQILAEGVTPPPKVDVTFHSEEERIRAQGMVDRKVYPDLESYVKYRDAKEDEVIHEENSMPKFTKK